MDEDFSIGVEEEFQIVDPVTRGLRQRVGRVLPRAQRAAGEEGVTSELYQSQIETGTPVCRDLGAVRAELTRLRRVVIEAARRDGCRIATLGTHPFSHWRDQSLTPKARYHEIAADFAQLAREQVICGCHVHVGLADPEAAVGVLNRARPWLSVLLALSANSPYWLGDDTGYASYRTELFGRFPNAGAPHEFADRAGYDDLVAGLVAVGAVADASFLYWDVRPSSHVPTLEFRVADVAATVDEAVLQAGLVRALVKTEYDAWRRGDPVPPVRPELLRAAAWRASRHGLDGDLVDPLNRRLLPAADQVNALLDHLRPALEAFGDWDEVSGLAARTLARGTGTRRQREAFARSGDPRDVVDHAVAEAERGAL